jgi:trimethylamine---corrinoid protein Co-methyltransferase
VAHHRLQLQVLSDEQLSEIESTAYRLLDEVGIALRHPQATEMLHGLGCRVVDGRVYIPPEVVAWGLSHVTAHRTHAGLDPNHSFTFGDGAIRFHNSGGPPFIHDLETGERRPATLHDQAEMTRLLDALPNVDMITPLFGPQDVPPGLINVMATAAMLRNTRKPVSAAAAENPDDVRYAVEMAAACCGGMDQFYAGPILSISVSPVSPLTFTPKVTSAIISVAEYGVPFHPLPAPSLGATGPITLAGALAQQHAESLAAFLIAAAVRPGLPVVYCSRINPIDMRTAISSWGGPEVGMAGAVAVQLAHRLNLPCDVYGLCSSAARLDPQYAYERMANALVPGLAGADIMSGVGGLESGLSGSFEAAVIDDEMIGLMKYVVGGVEVSTDTLALDMMAEVIPGDGIFLAQPHTVQQMRRGALWKPGVSERSVGNDAVGVVGRARVRAREILRAHSVPPLAEDVDRCLDEIIERARRATPAG